MSRRAAGSSIRLTLYAATIGTPASASSSVDVPDLVNAARAVRKASFFSLASTITRVGTRHEATAARTVSASLGTAGTTASMSPNCSATRAIAAPKTGAMRRISPAGSPALPAATAARPSAVVFQDRLAANRRSALSMDDRHNCTAARRAHSGLLVRTVAAQARDQCTRASRARVRAAKPTPTGRRSRRSEFQERGRGQRAPRDG